MQGQQRNKILAHSQSVKHGSMFSAQKNGVHRRTSATVGNTIGDPEGAENSDDNNDNEDDEDEDGKEVTTLPAGAGDSDDEYDGIPSASDDDSASEDEDEEDNVLRAAEVDLIDEFERTEQRRNASAVTTDFDNMFLQDEDTWDPMSTTRTRANGFDMNNDPFVGLASNDTLYQEMWNDAEDALASWRLPNTTARRTNSHESIGTKKRVRFEEEALIEAHSRTSSMSSSEDPNEVFPDLFTSQDDPSLRQCFGLDIDPDATFDHDYSDAGSCFDFDDDEERLALAIDEQSDTDSATSSVLSADDEGDTTDEETEEQSMARMREMQRARGILRSPRLAPTTPTQARRLSSSRSQTTPRVVTPKNGKVPRPGTFKLDPTRAAMSVDVTGKKFKLIPPTKPLEKDRAFWRRARTAANSRQTSPVSSPGLSFRSPNGAQMPPRPFTAQSTLGSMFDGNLEFLQNNADHDTGAEFFAVVSNTLLTTCPQTSFGSTTLTEDSDDNIEDVNMQDFIDMEGYDSDSDEMQSGTITSPSRPKSIDNIDAHATEYGLLDHLDQQRGLVGSFRLNQNQVKHVSSLASHPAKRALTLESNALQKGRRGAANTPMTPARKKRGSQDFGLTGSGIRKVVNSPLASRRPRSRGASLSGPGMQQTLSPSIMR